MASHVAASAYGHCLALVGDDGTAADLAATAARRGGRALGTVLGHARHLCLQHLAAQAPEDPPALAPDTPPADVAWALARTRHPLELAVVDLSGRYGLGRAGLGLALRLTPSAAAARVAAVDQAWAAELDPALLAWLGPGDCPELGATIDGPPATTAADLLAVGADVAAHAFGCPACADRLRAVPSVRLLVNGLPLPVPPPTVEAAAAGGRLQPPVLPPALEGGGRRRGTRALAAAAGVLAVAGIALAVAQLGDGAGNAPEGLQALSPIPVSAGRLQLVPAALAASAGEVVLRNDSDADVAWEAATDAPWLDVVPADGRLGAGQSQALALKGAPPEGDVRASVRVAGDDGSAVAATLAGTVERPPDLGATAEGCQVMADVEDEGDVALTLHWRDGAGLEQSAPMRPVDTAVVGTLPAGQAPLVWWVSAEDGRGNQARTHDATLPAGC